MDLEIKKNLSSNWFKSLQDSICNCINELENNKIKFQSTTWKRNQKKDEGGGRSKLLKNGNIFEKVGEISGSDEFADKLDYLITLMDEDEVDFEKLQSSANDTYVLFQQEIDWRKNFKKKHMNKINAHDKIISETIGLRLQSKLTKEQAIYVSRCNSIHRDISLNF